MTAATNGTTTNGSARWWIDEESDQDYVIRDRGDGGNEVARFALRDSAVEELNRLLDEAAEVAGASSVVAEEVA